MADTIRVLVVDDISATADHVSRLLSFESDLSVIGTASNGYDAIKMAHELMPDIVLMDINMPDLDGIETTERLTRELPAVSVVMMSVQAEGDYLRRSMLAGARAYLVKPFDADELAEALRGVFSRKVESNGRMVAVGPGQKASDQQQFGRIVALFSPKGGAGTTTVAVNLAVAIAEMEKRVAFLDADLQFGDAGVFLNLDPTNASIADVMAEMAQDNDDSVDPALLTHSSGLHVLLAPPTPDSAELVTSDRMRSVVGRLARTHEIVVVDCSSYLNEAILAILDMADEIISPVSLDIPAIRSARVFVDVSERLGYPESKLQMIINRADTNYGIRREDVERSVGRKIEHVIVGDARAAVRALNHGVPFVQDNKRAQISRDVIDLAQSLFQATSNEEVAATPPPPKARLDRRLVLARR